MKRRELSTWIHANVRLDFSRSKGPGGQNVNKVNTKVTARLRIADICILTSGQRELLLQRLGNRMNAEGEIVVAAQAERSQHRNRQAAVHRVTDLVLDALRTRKPRHQTRPSAASKERRLELKRIWSKKKVTRRRPDYSIE